ncbi:hypothetical protein [Georgenia daeguensis]|uniref:Uncharacterized protein n=1 Tax=Georgenia daeguensis TaxID=908355 RepID=A0ABP8ESF8_9MICO
MTIGGTGIVVLATAGFASSASADDGESLAGEVVAGVTGTVGEATAIAPPAIGAATQEFVTEVTAPISSEAEPAVQRAVEPPRDVAAPVVLGAVEPSAAVVEPAVRDVVAPAVVGVAPAVEQVVAPVAENVAAPVVEELTPVTNAVTDVLAPVVNGVVRPVTDALEPVSGPVTEVLVPLLPVADSPAPGLSQNPEVDDVPAGVNPGAGPSIDAGPAPSPVSSAAPPPDRAAGGAADASEAGRAVRVATAAPIAAGSQDGAVPGAVTDGSTSPSPPSRVPAPPGSAGTSHGAGSADADLARSLDLPPNDLSLSPAAAPPSAFLEVLLEISVAPD